MHLFNIFNIFHYNEVFVTHTYWIFQYLTDKFVLTPWHRFECYVDRGLCRCQNFNCIQFSLSLIDIRQAELRIHIVSSHIRRMNIFTFLLEKCFLISKLTAKWSPQKSPKSLKERPPDPANTQWKETFAAVVQLLQMPYNVLCWVLSRIWSCSSWWLNSTSWVTMMSGKWMSGSSFRTVGGSLSPVSRWAITSLIQV